MTNLNLLFTDSSGASTWVAEGEPLTARQRLPYQLLPVAGAVLLAHLGLFALLINQVSQKEVALDSVAPAATVRVSMVSPPPPPKAVMPLVAPKPTPQVLTSETAHRTIAQNSSKPVVKPQVRPKAQSETVPTPITKSVAPPTAAHIRPTEPRPAPPANDEPQNSPTLDLPSAGAKDVQTIGCRVPAPSYPRQARRLKIEGSVLVRLQIDTHGKVQSASVAQSSGNLQLDDAARSAVMSASCAPYLENGEAIAVRAVQPVTFSLSR